MATMTITIPDAVVGDVMDALIARGGVDPSSGTKPALAKAVVVDFIKTVYRHYKAEAAAETARAAALAQADAAAAIT